MSHIIGTIKWTQAIFSRYEEGANGLELFLSDGTHRTMLYKNWEDSFPATLQKLKRLNKNADFKFATWNGYDELIWFCDVEQV